MVNVLAVSLPVLTLSACALNFDATALGVPATMAAPAGNAPEGTNFRITRKAVFLLWGILPASRPSLEQTLAGQLIEGTGVANLRIRVSSRFTDLLIMTLTGGLVVPRSVTFEGTVVNAVGGGGADDGGGGARDP
jgi:hypothetical protein